MQLTECPIPISKEFHKNGIIYPMEVLNNAEVEAFCNRFRQIEELYDGYLPYLGNAHHYLKWVYDLALHRNIVEPVKQILGEEICVMSTLFLTKYPYTNAFVTWHQDGFNSNWNPNHSLTAWVSLTGSNTDNGCMRVIPGTHQNLLLEEKKANDSNNMLQKTFELPNELDESMAWNVELMPGEMSLHNNQILHSSLPNQSPTKRIGFIIRYGVTKFVEKGNQVIYERGGKRYDHLNELAQPKPLFPLNQKDKAFLKSNLMTKARMNP